VKLDDQTAIFIGFKLDGQLRRQLDSIEGANRRYVSRENSNFLRICQLGEDNYVGKVIVDRLTTDRVDDVRRNVLSILRRLCPESRFPEHMDVLVCGYDDGALQAPSD
jgi:hypothetical protein